MTDLLVLRPEPGATATARKAQRLGLRCAIAPLFGIAPVEWRAPPATHHDALMLTSANAVRHAGPALADYRDLPVFAVGGATADAAAAAGLRIAHSGDGDVVSLMRDMSLAGIRAPLHLTGETHREGDHPHLSICRVIVYRAEAVATLPKSAAQAIACGAIAMLHSPRAAAVFATLVGAASIPRGRIEAAVISGAAADALGGGWGTIAIASRPCDLALLAVAAALCESRRETRRDHA